MRKKVDLASFQTASELERFAGTWKNYEKKS